MENPIEEVEVNEEVAPPPKRNLLIVIMNRAGCCALLAVWLVVMAMPCAFITLLVEKELVYERSDLPEHEYRLFLMDNSDKRGLGFSRGSIKNGSENEGQYCIVTSVDYLMWEGEALPVDYCSCYEKIEGQWAISRFGGDKSCKFE